MRWSIYAVRTGEVEPPAEFRGESGDAASMPLISWLLVSGDRAVVVDCGADKQGAAAFSRTPFRPGTSVQDAAALLDVVPELILFTHLHWDHSTGGHQLREVPALAHPNEVAYAVDRSHPQARAYPPPRPDLESIREGFSPAPGIRVLELPGHTPGSVGFAVDAAEGTFLLAGDLIAQGSQMSALPWRVPTVVWDADEAARSVARVQHEFDASFVLPAHDAAIFTDVDVQQVHIDVRDRVRI